MRLSLDAVDITVGGTGIVHGATFAVESGQVAGLIGPNGSGKSTLLRSIYRVHRPTRGTVHVGGDDVWAMPVRSVARLVAVMAQETTADFDLDVLDVVLLGRLAHHRGFGGDDEGDHRLAVRALHDVGAHDLAERAFAGLSGGEKQRVLLARAMVQQSPVLVLDEPTNHLDIAFQLDMMRIVGGLGLTTLVALHDLNLAVSACDVVGVMQAGRLIAFGPPTEILTTDLIGDVFGVRAHHLRHPGTGDLLIAFSPAPSTAPPPSSPRTRTEAHR